MIWSRDSRTPTEQQVIVIKIKVSRMKSDIDVLKKRIED